MTPEQHEIERRRAWVAFAIERAKTAQPFERQEKTPMVGGYSKVAVTVSMQAAGFANDMLAAYDARFPAPVEREAEPVQSGELPRVQSLPAVGATIEEMRINLDRTSPEYAAGDMVLRWVNEGAIIMHGGVFKPAPKEPFQKQVLAWLHACFGEAIAADTLERADRFVEEALELAQTDPQFTADRAHALVDYVFGRPAGTPSQEAGGVMLTLAGLCEARCIDLDAAARAELARVWTKVEAIRAKQAAKPIGSALPVAPTDPDWIDHTPGDPMPVLPGTRVDIKMKCGRRLYGVTLKPDAWEADLVDPGSQIIQWKPAQ